MRVYLDTVGCRLNQAEIEGMAGRFRAAGHEIVAAAEQADLAVVNTCSVTSSAAADSRALIHRLAGHSKAGIVATGCWATLRPSEARALPGVLAIVPNARKDALVAEVLGLAQEAPAIDALPRHPIPGARHRTRAFIKVQDGCDNHCTFCVTTIARGVARSRACLDVVADVRAALQGGAKEIVLTGVHLGSWGAEIGLCLSQLLTAILRETDAPRLRLSSLEPWDIDREFFRLWEDRRLCRHFHLPLQSGCAATLRRMRRRTTPEAYRELVDAARSLLPDAAITTDVISGFPGETEDEFRASLEFVGEMDLAGGHAFTYSAMAGTAAARMRDQVPADVRRRRTRCFAELFEAAGRRFRSKHLGTRRAVLWESAAAVEQGGWQMGGLTDNYIRVEAWSPESHWNRIEPVLLDAATNGRMHGILVESGQVSLMGKAAVTV